MAEQAGDATPDGVQRLLYNYWWDADLVRDDLKSYVVEHLSAADAVLVVDETGFLKKGDKSVGVQRQYSGTAGRIENCQIGVFLAYASARGRTLLDRELYLPQVWAEDWERRREAGVPESVGFRTKPQLAQLMLKRALESGVPFGWVAGDEVYGNDRKLRRWLERAGIPHVLAIRSNEKLWVWTDQGLCQVRADRLTSQVDELGWTRCSAGDGAKGPRVYDWAVVDRRQLVLPVATTIFAGRYGVIIRYGGTVDYRPTNQAIEAETYGRQDTGNGSGQGWDERAFSAQVAEWAIAVAGETGASVAHSAGSLRRGVGG